MAQLKRWVIANKLYAGLFILLAIFGYLDAVQIKTFHIIDTQQAWDLFNSLTGPAFWALWYVAIIAIGLVYFLFSKDKSETLGLIAAGFILLLMSVEDLFFFIFSDQPMTQCMRWFNELNPQLTWWSTHIWGETCVSPTALISFAILGIIISYVVFNKLKRARW